LVFVLTTKNEVKWKKIKAAKAPLMGDAGAQSGGGRREAMGGGGGGGRKAQSARHC